MVKEKLILRFPSNLVEQPFIYHLVKDYDLMVNIIRADINPNKEGRLMLELSGEENSFWQALNWLQENGLQVMNLKQQIAWIEERCTHCGACSVFCPSGALVLNRSDMKIHFEEDKCVVCGLCIRACPARAMETLLENNK